MVFVAVVAVVVWRVRFAPAPVEEHVAAGGEVVVEVMGTGTLEAHIEATLSPKIQGLLTQVLVDQNDRVTENQLLAQLDDGEWKQQVAVARAALDTSFATIDRVKAEQARAEAVLSQARLDHDRALDLRKADIAAQADMDRAEESLKTAAADLARAGFAITEAELQKVTAEMNLKFHEARLGDTRILSPFDGLVVRRDRHPGDVVVPGSSLLHVISTNELWISAWVDETEMSRLRVGQAARVVFRSEPAMQYAGVVARLGRQTDRETREFLVDVSVAALPENWAVGQRAEVYVEADRKTCPVVIPAEFVLWSEGQARVCVNRQGRAELRSVTLGLAGADSVEVVQGLQAGEIVALPMGKKQKPLRDGDGIKAP